MSKNAIDPDEAEEVIQRKLDKEKKSASTQWSLSKFGESFNVNGINSAVGKLLWGQAYVENEQRLEKEKRAESRRGSAMSCSSVASEAPVRTDSEVPAHAVEIESGSYSSGDFAKFQVLGKTPTMSVGRGLNFVALDSSLQVQSTATFDTCTDAAAVPKMVEWIKDLSEATIVLIACKDSATGGTWRPETASAMADLGGYDALRSLGGSGAPFQFREAFAFVGVKGGTVGFSGGSGAPFQFREALARERRNTDKPVKLVVTSSELKLLQALGVVLVQAEGFPTVRLYGEPREGAPVIREIPSDSHGYLHEQRHETGSFCRVTVKADKTPSDSIEGWVGTKNVRLAAPHESDAPKINSPASGGYVGVGSLMRLMTLPER